MTDLYLCPNPFYSTDQSILYQLKVEGKEINAALERITKGTYGICEKQANTSFLSD